MRKIFFLALIPFIVHADAHIFVFHRFGDPHHTSTNTSIATLRSEFEFLKTNGYEVVSLIRVHQALLRQEEISDKWVVFTIDDSYKSFYDNALELFKEYAYPFTLFVYIEATDKKYGDFMTWEQIREAGQYGEIALHSYGHPHMVSLTTQEIKTDTDKAIASFEKQMGYTPEYYAYPYGEYNSEVREAIESYGFRLIVNQNSGAVSTASDSNDLDRIALTGENLLKEKLRIKHLPTEWITLQKWPDNSVLKTIHAKIPSEITSAEYFISGYGWKRIEVMNGEVEEEIDLPLIQTRTRLFLRDGRRQSSLILVKE